MSIVNRVILKKSVVSSTIKTATALDLTDLAYGEFIITNVILKTDSTGLAGGTNFQVITTNANGLAVVLSTAISGLGANKTIDITTASVTKQPTVLENGKKIQIQNTAADGSGAGVVDIYIVLEKVTANASINVV